MGISGLSVSRLCGREAGSPGMAGLPWRHGYWETGLPSLVGRQGSVANLPFALLKVHGTQKFMSSMTLWVLWILIIGQNSVSLENFHPALHVNYMLLCPPEAGVSSTLVSLEELIEYSKVIPGWLVMLLFQGIWFSWVHDPCVNIPAMQTGKLMESVTFKQWDGIFKGA